MQEQFGYAYDKAWNLNERTNNAMVQTFGENGVNELTTSAVAGTLTVAGTATEPAANPPYSGVTNLTVNGQPADVYGDSTFAAAGFTPANGNNAYTAIAQDTYGRNSTNSVTVTVSSSADYTYDSNGNLTSDGTRNFAYNDENQLVAVWVSDAWSNSFAYDGLMRKRIEQDFAWNGGGWTQTNEILYVYDGNLVLQERDQHDEPLTTYTRGVDVSGTLDGAGGIGGLLARSDNQKIVPAILSPVNPNPQNVVTSYYFNDGQGNVVALVSPSGMFLAQYEYDPFGNLISKSGLMADMNKYRFSSKEWDENAGLYYYGYRCYDSNLQRWLNRDPIQEGGGINLFAFVANCPIGAFDPDGFCPTDDSVTSSADNPGAVGQIARETLAESKDKSAQDIAEDALNSSRKQATDDLREAMNTPENESPHHNIPYEFNDNPLVQKAAEDGWNVNGANNGTNLPKDLHYGWKNWNRWHKLYNQMVKQRLDQAWDPNMSPQQAAQQLQQISDYMGKAAKLMCQENQ